MIEEKIGNPHAVSAVPSSVEAWSTTWLMVLRQLRIVLRNTLYVPLVRPLGNFYPVSLYCLLTCTIRPLKIPLSAFILQDMDELVQAHATYRFILLDEEEEKPRILVNLLIFSLLSISSRRFYLDMVIQTPHANIICQL